jgi:hypothetical protein
LPPTSATTWRCSSRSHPMPAELAIVHFALIVMMILALGAEEAMAHHGVRYL